MLLLDSSLTGDPAWMDPVARFAAPAAAAPAKDGEDDPAEDSTT